MNTDKKLKFHDWCSTIDTPFWTDADFESMNIPVHDPQRKTIFTQKPKVVRYNIVKNPHFGRRYFGRQRLF